MIEVKMEGKQANDVALNQEVNVLDLVVHMLLQQIIDEQKEK